MQKYEMHQSLQYDVSKDEIVLLLAEMVIALNVELKTVTFLFNIYKRMSTIEIVRPKHITSILQIITAKVKEKKN